MLDLIEAGRKVADVAHDLGISGQTIYSWRRQDRIDRGLESGLTRASKQPGAIHSSRAQLLEAKENLQRMRAAIPLTDDEEAAVDDGQQAIDRLLERLADTPTPAGPTPRQLEGIAARFHIMARLRWPSTTPEL